MKKYILPILLLATSLTACNTYPLKEVTYSETVYQTGFYDYGKGYYDHLAVIGVSKPNEEPLFTQKKYDFWNIEFSNFKMLFANHQEAAVWGPTMYVSKDNFEKAKSFYADTKNFNYYIGKYLDNEKRTIIEDSGVFDTLEKTIQMILSDAKGYETVSKEISGEVDLAVFRESKDGLFSTYRENITYHQGQFYYLKYYDGSNNKSTLAVIDEKENSVLLELFKANSYIS